MLRNSPVRLGRGTVQADRGAQAYAVIFIVTEPVLRYSRSNTGLLMIIECKYCAKTFSATNFRRLFCSDRCKTRYNRENALTCFYCGDLPGTRDHVMPHSVSGFPKRRWANLDYVNCCHECNVIISNNYPYSMTDRIRFLIERFTKKHKLDKPTVQWDEDELKELSQNLGDTIRQQMRLWNKRHDRLNHMRLRLIHVSRFDDEDIVKPMQGPFQE